MNKPNIKGELRSTKHTDIQQQPPRVAARMEGVVKNRGTKKQKKEPKEN
jgi:hypothetical protein